MVYQGSKNKLAKHIIPILQEYIDNNNITLFIDCFCGGANIVDKIKCKTCIASDLNPDLISLLKYIQTDNTISIAPEDCNFEHYVDVRNNRHTNKYSQEYTALIGYCASYGGRYFDGGYGRDSSGGRSIYKERLENLKKQSPNLNNIEFYVKDYKDYLNLGIKNALIYCDPPYRNTKQYTKQNINYEEFYNFCREMSKDNIVIISEYSMPEDFICIWEKERKILQNSNRIKGENAVEKLFILNTNIKRICRKCGNIVTKSECDRIDEFGNKYYPYQCLNCDEDLFEFETIMTSKNNTNH